MATVNEFDFDNVVTVDTTVHTEQDFFESNEASQAEYQWERECESTAYWDMMDDEEYDNLNCNEI